MYRIKPPDWNVLARDHPIHFSLGPTQMLGDDDYHLSAGGVQVLTFVPLASTREAVAGIDLTVELPAEVGIVSHSTSHPMRRLALERGGQAYTACTFALNSNVLNG